jgi:hypothetical protein
MSGWEGAGGGGDDGTFGSFSGGGAGSDEEEAKVLRVLVHEACNIQDVQLFGAMDPFVELCTLPSGEAVARTGMAESGGRRPVWDSSHGHALETAPRATDTSVRLRVMNANMVVDDLVGFVDVPLDACTSAATRTRLALSTGGVLEVTLVYRLPSEMEGGANPFFKHETKDSRLALTNVLSIEVSTAENLPNLQVYGEQDPYVVASLPSERSKVAMTKWVAGGGVNPSWDASHDNVMFFVPDEQEDHELKLQVFNANMLTDELIACVHVPLRYEELRAPKRCRFPLLPRGVLTCTLCCGVSSKLQAGVCTEDTAEVGSRVVRGPHWNKGAQDGGAGKLGTVLAFKRGDGARVGDGSITEELSAKGAGKAKGPLADKVLDRLPALSAVVKWDKGGDSHRCFYFIGFRSEYQLQLAGAGADGEVETIDWTETIAPTEEEERSNEKRRRQKLKQKAAAKEEEEEAVRKRAAAAEGASSKTLRAAAKAKAKADAKASGVTSKAMRAKAMAKAKAAKGGAAVGGEGGAEDEGEDEDEGSEEEEDSEGEDGDAEEGEDGLFATAGRVSSAFAGGISDSITSLMGGGGGFFGGGDGDGDGGGGGGGGGSDGEAEDGEAVQGEQSRDEQFFSAMREKKEADAAEEERKRAATLSAMGEAERGEFEAKEVAAKEHEEKKAATMQKQMGAFAGRGAKAKGALRGRGRGRGRGGRGSSQA